MTPHKNSTHPPYRILGKTRFVRINGGWLSTAAIELITQPESGCVKIRTVSGDVISVEGVYNADALARGVLGERFDAPTD